MRKKLLLVVLAFIYMVYAYAIATNSNPIGDSVSPIIMLVITGCIFYGFVWKQNIKVFRWAGLSLFLAICSWFFCDLWWGIQTLVLHVDPEDNFITIYGYSLTNIFLLVTILITGYQDLKRMNKIQAMLDTIIVFVCMGVLIWLFVFEQQSEKVEVLLSDQVTFLSIIIDVFIFAWSNVWAFSTRLIKPPLYQQVLVTGGVIFAITDLAYYYVYYYTSYEPNSWIDGAYVLAFSCIALATCMKRKTKVGSSVKPLESKVHSKLRMDLLVLVAPLAVFIWKRDQMQYVLLLLVALMIYYILINYTQKSAFQKTLLELEKRNVSELERKVFERTEEIVRIQNTDYLSGLYSRRYFDEKLSRVIQNIRKDENISLLYIDQNKSKSIRYLFGKDTAEHLLKKVAEAVRKIASGDNVTLAAYGDDVFVIMIQGNDSQVVAKKMAERIIKRCDELFMVDNHAIRVTINIGIACYPIDTSNVNDLIKNADIAMMQARAKGFNQIQLYDDKIGNLTYSRHRIEMKLKKVSYDQEFFLYYQPQVYSDSGELCGFEALIRWQDDSGKFIPPLDFIPVAEEIGLIVPMGYWIIETAAAQQAKWREKTGKNHRIAVNVSSRQLVEVNFVQRLQNLLEKYQVPPESFEIEITESQQIENSMNISETLDAIKALGISLAIDDFGTGYSSLYYIKNLPADRIKIAKELIDNIENDIYSYYIIQMVISIAREKGIAVIAEGVETKEQWNYLKELGCDEIQGYYFAKPMAAREIEETWI